MNIVFKVIEIILININNNSSLSLAEWIIITIIIIMKLNKMIIIKKFKNMSIFIPSLTMFKQHH